MSRALRRLESRVVQDLVNCVEACERFAPEESRRAFLGLMADGAAPGGKLWPADVEKASDAAADALPLGYARNAFVALSNAAHLRRKAALASGENADTCAEQPEDLLEWALAACAQVRHHILMALIGASPEMPATALR